MGSKKSLVWWIPLMVICFFIAAKSFGFTNEPNTKYERIITTVAALLEQGHYSPKKIDDAFSREVFYKYLDNVDPEKNILLQTDVDELKKFETKIDDELHGSHLEFVSSVNTIYNKRLNEIVSIYKSVLSKPFDFSKDETVNLDVDKLNFPRNEAERKEYCRKQLKYYTLQRYAEALEMREKNKDSANFIVKADTTLERESREKVLKIMDRKYDRYKNKFTEEEKFNLYINTICASMDPHTDFFPPIEKRAFDESMSGRFYGIGAQLGEQEGVIKIVSVITGSPAWKTSAIKAGDVILKVAQGSEEPVDISGYETTDVVKLIRGKKGTEVRLTLKKADGSIKVVPIIRDEIVQEETYARSAIVKNANGNKIGYIYLPEFYADFEKPDGPRCARDVAIEVQKLKAENVDGIIMDLRNNGGGSLQDVIQMVGLFIEDGPVVQVRDKNGQPTIYRDKDKSILYDGPLVVMINENSASASEIFAAAIQDYKRGIVIGSKSYGKGTVQRSFGVDKNIGNFIPVTELGSIKMTIQKFYRINGGSTQLKGVSPDVQIPDQFEFSKIYDKEKKDELPWDEISRAPFSQWNSGFDLQTISTANQTKVNNNNSFKLIRKNAEWLAKENDKEYNLNLVKFQNEQKVVKATFKQIDSLLTISDSAMNISFMKQDEEKVNKMDKDKAERFKGWLKSLGKDIYLDEAIKIANDIVVQGRLAKK